MSRLFDQLVEIYLGPVLGWADITADVQGPISITRGRTSEGNQADPGRCSLRLDNRAGDYSPRNPAGAYYGRLGRNTPIRVSAGLTGGTLVQRFHGEVAAWPARWSTDGVDRYVDVEAAGILRRLGQGEQPAWSALRRTITASGAVAYWPGEDGAAAAGAGSALAGHDPLTLVGSAEFVALDDRILSTGRTVRYGTGRIMDLAGGGRLAATVPSEVTAATATAWTAGVAAQIDVASASGDVVLLEVDTPGGTYVKWQLVLVQATLHGLVVAIDPAGGATTLIDIAGVTTSFSFFDLSVWQSTSIRVGLRWSHGLGLWAGTATVPGTVTGITAVRVNPTGATSSVPWPVGHVAVWPDWPYPPGLSNAADAYGVTVSSAIQSWRDEAAHDRLARLAAEDGVPLSMSAVPADLVQRMGWQPAATLADLYRECADVDGGILHETRDALGLTYRTRDSLYNQTPTPISYLGQLAPPFDPVDDADQVRNDVTVKRTAGASARLIQTTGPLAAVPPPDGVGIYRTEVEVNAATDAGLVDQAGWRLHLGTVDRPRYPALSVQLASPEWQADPAGLAALLTVDTGDVLKVVGAPSWAAGDIRTLVLGYTEQISEWLWSITFAGVPAQPWDVAEVDGDARVPMDGGTLAASCTATATSLSLASTAANGVWTRDPADFPLDLRIGEERVTVSAISGAASPQTATVSARSVNGVVAAWPAGTPVDVWTPAIAPL